MPAEATPTSRPDNGPGKKEETVKVPEQSQEHRNLTGLGVAYSSGNKDGYEEGFREGFQKGHDKGYDEGYQDGKKDRIPAI